MRIIGAGAATLIFVVLLTFYATGPSRTGSGKRCPTTAVAFCFVDSNGHVTLARRTNAWERFKGAVTGTP
jgi:hypothetical protein